MSIGGCIYFVDVGQGSAQVVLFPDDSVVVIDCGPCSEPIVNLLSSLSFSRIRAVVLSHWHKDHVAGAPDLVRHYLDDIDVVYIPRDRPTNQIIEHQTYLEIEELSENERRFKIDFLVHQSNLAGRLWPTQREPDSADLTLIYPTARHSMQQESQTDANQGSGVLCLHWNDARILIPGDAGRKPFEAIHEKNDCQPLQCDVIAAPHHMGKLSQSSETYRGFASCYEWLYKSVVNARLTIVSVGTTNDHNHPRLSHVEASRKYGSEIVCTQITSVCHVDLRSVLPLVDSGNDHPAACRSHSSDGVGCAGTIQVDLTKSGAVMHRRAHINRQLTPSLTTHWLYVGEACLRLDLTKQRTFWPMGATGRPTPQ